MVISQQNMNHSPKNTAHNSSLIFEEICLHVHFHHLLESILENSRNKELYFKQIPESIN